MRTTKSPRKVFIIAWKLASSSLPAYGSKDSRKDFTLPHLFACLALRQFYGLSYRGVEELLADSPLWRRAETVNSMIKRNQGSALTSRSNDPREREMLLKALVHNLSI